jgi:hypothetical protein
MEKIVTRDGQTPCDDDRYSKCERNQARQTDHCHGASDDVIFDKLSSIWCCHLLFTHSREAALNASRLVDAQILRDAQL